jgi:hypothetical protein
LACSLARYEELVPEDSPTPCIDCGEQSRNGTFVLSTHISYDLGTVKWSVFAMLGPQNRLRGCAPIVANAPGRGCNTGDSDVSRSRRKQAVNRPDGLLGRHRGTKTRIWRPDEGIVARRWSAADSASEPRFVPDRKGGRGYFLGRDSGGTPPVAR